LSPKIYPHIIPTIEEWPIYKLGKRREQYIAELRAHVKKIILQKYSDKLKIVLRRTAYQERTRIKNQPWKADPSSDRVFWKKVQASVAKLPDDGDEVHPDAEELLDRIIHRYAEEIVGNFKIKTFLFARKFLTAFFSFILNAANGRIFGRKKRLQEKMIVEGEVEKLRSLFQKGTVVVLPTHFSNLDSILIGYSIDSIIGIPAFTYGAGLNLYDSEIFGYFMNRLGAYRVDRRKKNPLYIETLKSMSSQSIQQGVNSLFFPGGTRSRSGALEKELKQGLLNSLIEGQREIFQRGGDKKIIVVPFVFNYHFTLEANHLISQHLNQLGKENFVRVKDEFKSKKKLLKFIWQIFTKPSEFYLSVGNPLDVLGNELDDDGESIDSHGKKLDLREYFTSDGIVTHDPQREKVYTRHLSDSVVESYHRYNIALSSHVVAFCAFQYLKRANETLDIFGLIKLPEDEFFFEESALIKLIDQVKSHLLQLASEKGVMTSFKEKHTSKDILEEGLRNLGVYHAIKPLKRDKNGQVISENFKTLFYYHNRLDGYKMADSIDWSDIDIID